MSATNELTTSRIHDLHTALEEGVPFTQTIKGPDKLHFIVADLATKSCVEAHESLYEAIATHPERVATFGKSFDESQYISWALENGAPAFSAEDSQKPNTDTGIRTVNPESADNATNKATVIHTTKWSNRYTTLGRPGLESAMRSLGIVADSIRRQLVEPYLKAVAVIHGINPDEYYEHYFSPDRNGSSIMRAIMYHADATVPAVDGNTELLIKEHVDQSGFTVNVYTSGPGLQYMDKDGIWHDSHQIPFHEVAIFPGAGEQHLPNKIDPIVHRVKKIPQPRTVEYCILQNSQDRTNTGTPRIDRISFPYFISSQEPDAKVVPPHSEVTHPLHIS